MILCGDSGVASPYVFSVFVALTEKGVPFEYRPVALDKSEQKKPEYIRDSLTGKVPALQDDGFWLSESSAILEWLEERHPTPSIYPADPKLRARARQLMAWLRSGDLGALREVRSSETIFAKSAVPPLSGAAAEAATKLIAVADRLVTDGAATAFGTWSLADADLAFMLQRMIANGDDVPEKLRDYARAQWKRPSVQRFVDQPRG